MLTPRELQVLRMIAWGYPPRQAARKLGISYDTLRNHLTNAYRHLDARNMPHAMVLAWGFAAAIGVGFGLYPAVKASQLNPIEALRYE